MKNIYFYIKEIKEIKENDIHFPLIIYKNNNVIKQIFYETQDIFLLKNFMIRQPHH